MTDIRKAILSAMKRQGVNANQLAVAVDGNISRSQVYDYLSGKSDLGGDGLKFMLEALGLVVQKK